MTTTDPTRSPPARNRRSPTPGVDDDAAADVLAERTEDVVEAHAPGFRDRILHRIVQRPGTCRTVTPTSWARAARPTGLLPRQAGGCGGRVTDRRAHLRGPRGRRVVLEWFRGGLVAYASEVKHAVLHVAQGPVVSAEAAHAMGVGVRDLLHADLALAATGAGGPAPQDDQEPGTVFLAMVNGSDSGSEPVRRHIDGDTNQVCDTTVNEALTLLAERLRLPVVTSSGVIGSG
jgi:nicotinamide-nucleotide amidase